MKPDDLRKYADKLKGLKLERDVNIMEVCGTHTTEFFRTGVKDIFPTRLTLVDGPGCPVCVTPNEYLDRAFEIVRQYGAMIATFGDMMRVPSSYSSLQQEKAAGVEVEVVYSPMDALQLAREYPDKEVIFLSVGFETTIPAEAAALIHARKENIANFSLLAGNKLTPTAVRALLVSGEVKIDGFILPGHVSVVTGIRAWRFIASEFGKPAVIAGFNSKDLLLGTLLLLKLIKEARSEVVNEYTEAVTEDGNPKAREIMDQVFIPCEAGWRGIGQIPGSGMQLRPEFKDFDAQQKFPVSLPPPREPKGCRCGDVLRGLILPPGCPLFGKVCTPQQPVGACMVSSEGSCAAFYKYGGLEVRGLSDEG